MAWLVTLRLVAPFMAMGLLAGLLFGVATGEHLYFAGMGFAAGTMMGAAWLVRMRKAERTAEPAEEQTADLPAVGKGKDDPPSAPSSPSRRRPERDR